MVKKTQDKDEYEYDQINGARGRRPKMAVLNKKDLSSYEMDELFNTIE